jgi:D-3-phosphoglycerate dehydrogenase / 2-oxoglutarate reductase
VKILVAESLAPAAIDRLRAAGHQVVDPKGLQGEALIAALDGCAGLIVRGATKVTGEVLRGANGLKVVARAGTGLDNVDVAEAKRLGIAVVNAPAANTISVAELVFAMILGLERHIGPACADLRQGRWEKTKYSGREIAGKRLGLIGFGSIGRAVAVRARAFEMDVWASDPWVVPWPAEYGWVRSCTLDELLPASDYVSLHLPLIEETRGLIGAKSLALMKPDAVLIQAARGGIVDEAALAEALATGKLRGAALDVFATEPPGASPLLGLPNVVATPHLGAATREAQDRAGVEVAARVIELLAAR